MFIFKSDSKIRCVNCQDLWILFLSVFCPSYLSSLASSFIQVLIRRRPLLYVVGLLIPSIFLMLVDVMSFYLPLNSGTRITFKISILLGYTVFRVNMTDELPVTAVRTSLIGGILKTHICKANNLYPVFYSVTEARKVNVK